DSARLFIVPAIAAQPAWTGFAGPAPRALNHKQATFPRGRCAAPLCFGVDMSSPVCTAMRSSCLCVAVVAALFSPLPAPAAATPAPDDAAPQATTLDAIHVHGVLRDPV